MPKEVIATNHAPQDPAGEAAHEWLLSVGWIQDGADVQVGAGITGDYDAGQFFCLDRSQVNRLIRILRKARDQAFGADA